MAIPNMRLKTSRPNSWPSAPALMMLAGSMRLKIEVQSFALSCWEPVNFALSVSEVWAGALSNT